MGLISLLSKGLSTVFSSTSSKASILQHSAVWSGSHVDTCLVERSKALLRRKKYTGLFQKGSSSPLAGSRRGFFSNNWESGQDPGDKTHKSVGVSFWLDPPWSCLTPSVFNWASAIHQLQFRSSYSMLVPAEVAAPVSHDALYSPVDFSHLGGTILLWDLISLMDLWRIDFSVCSTFCLLLGWCGDFQASCMTDWKTKVLLPLFAYSLNLYIESFYIACFIPNWTFLSEYFKVI